MEKEQPLEKLQAKIDQFDAALSKVRETSTNLGGGNGPIRLNYSLANLSELDLSERITKVVGIRHQMIIRTIPKLEADKVVVLSQIEAHTESRLISNIELVRSLLGQGATEKELELAEQALKNYRARTVEAQPAAPAEAPTPTPPAETPSAKEPEISEEERGRRQKLMNLIENSDMSDLQKRIWTVAIPCTKENTLTNTAWARTVYGDQIPLKQAIARLDTMRMNSIKRKQLPENIKLVNIYPRGAGKTGYYLELIEIPSDLKDEEEKQRRQALLDIINSADLTNQEQKVFAAGVIYSEQNMGSNENWAPLVYPDLPVKQAVSNLEVRRKKGLTKLTGKIELVTVWPDKRTRGRRAGYYLKLKEGTPIIPADAETVERINRLQADIAELEVALEQTTSEPDLSKRIAKGLEEKRGQLAELQTGTKYQKSSNSSS